MAFANTNTTSFANTKYHTQKLRNKCYDRANTMQHLGICKLDWNIIIKKILEILQNIIVGLETNKSNVLTDWVEWTLFFSPVDDRIPLFTQAILMLDTELKRHSK